jgi:hypothetical protein
MNRPVDVVIGRTDSGREPPALGIFYRVSNGGPEPIWLVNDGWIVWSRSGGQIEISLARGKMNPGSAVFGYFVPATVEIPPGSLREGSLTLHWPLQLDRLWNSEAIVRPAPGRYDFALRIGYGVTPRAEDPVPGESVETPVLRWQKQALSAPVSVEVT